jgi:hypothetical protein
MLVILSEASSAGAGGEDAQSKDPAAVSQRPLASFTFSLPCDK